MGTMRVQRQRGCYPGDIALIWFSRNGSINPTSLQRDLILALFACQKDFHSCIPKGLRQRWHIASACGLTMPCCVYDIRALILKDVSLGNANCHTHI